MLPLLRQLMVWTQRQAAGDGELLRRLREARDEEAFATLLARHGAMVFGVCRRVCRRPEDAEDAFQATFILLFTQVRKLRQAESLAGWLHRVAYRTALNADRRRQREPRGGGPEPADPAPPAGQGSEQEEAARLLHAALAELPDWLRTPVALCDLQGLSRAEAARRLGVSEGTLSSRLHRGKARLRGKLLRRGVRPEALATLGAALALEATAAAPFALHTKTTELFTGLATGGALAQTASRELLLLAAGGATMTGFRLVAVATIACVLALGAGFSLAGWGQGPGAQKADPKPTATAAAAVAQPMPPTKEQADLLKALQGTWQHEKRNEVTNEVKILETLAIRGDKFVRKHETRERKFESLIGKVDVRTVKGKPALFMDDAGWRGGPSFAKDPATGKLVTPDPEAYCIAFRVVGDSLELAFPSSGSSEVVGPRPISVDWEPSLTRPKDLPAYIQFIVQRFKRVAAEQPEAAAARNTAGTEESLNELRCEILNIGAKIRDVVKENPFLAVPAAVQEQEVVALRAAVNEARTKAERLQGLSDELKRRADAKNERLLLALMRSEQFLPYVQRVRKEGVEEKTVNFFVQPMLDILAVEIDHAKATLKRSSDLLAVSISEAGVHQSYFDGLESLKKQRETLLQMLFELEAKQLRQRWEGKVGGR